MRLSQLLYGIVSYDAFSEYDPEILQITENSAKCKENSLFVCVKGYRTDGHCYAADAYRRGCRVFVAQDPLSLPKDALVLTVENSERALALLACRFYGDPSRHMRVIGITGTKGKTTTACLLAHLLNKAGIPCGYIGTNGITYGSVSSPTVNTTPDAVTLQSALRDMLDNACSVAVLEVSSQALKRHRIDGTKLEACVFTNFSPDHIGCGEHSDLNDYKQCKKRLFAELGGTVFFGNADDEVTAEMLSAGSPSKTVFFSLHSPAPYKATNIQPTLLEHAIGSMFCVECGAEKHEIELPLSGIGNVYNALCTLAISKELFGISLQNAANSIKNVNIEGRSEVIRLPNGAVAVIDYAHNAVGLRQLLEDLKKLRGNRLICLFGSVGERTKLRRAELGAVAAELADLCVLTSDNPGSEPPESIIADIATAFEGSSTPYLSIPDREEAILTAARLSEAGDILVLAGKGHERYQLIGTRRIPFSEKEILLRFCANHIALPQ